MKKIPVFCKKALGGKQPRLKNDHHRRAVLRNYGIGVDQLPGLSRHGTLRIYQTAGTAAFQKGLLTGICGVV